VDLSKVSTHKVYVMCQRLLVLMMKTPQKTILLTKIINGKIIGVMIRDRASLMRRNLGKRCLLEKALSLRMKLTSRWCKMNTIKLIAVK